MASETVANAAEPGRRRAAWAAGGLVLALLGGAGALAAGDLTCTDFSRLEKNSRSEPPLGPEALGNTAGVTTKQAHTWLEGRQPAAPAGGSDETESESEDRQRAEAIWQNDRHMGARRLASQAKVDPGKARGWIEAWRREEESDCKLYPRGPASGDGAGAAGDESETEDRQQAQRTSQKDPIEDFEEWLDKHEKEKEACGPRTAACFYFIVDCKLPPRLRRIGRRMPSITPGRWVRTTGGECWQRRGSFQRIDWTVERTAERESSPFRLVVRYADGREREISRPEPQSTKRDSAKTPPPMWERDAKLGKACAQNYLGEIRRREGDNKDALHWFGEAAAQGYPEALINLGNLYERGLGVESDPLAALECYAAATGDEGLLLAEIDENLPTETREKIKTRATRAGKLRGPSIEVVDPWFPASRPQFRVGEKVTERWLFGRIFAVADLRTLELAGGDDSEAVAWEKDLSFKHRIPLPAEQDDFSFELTATDKQGKTDPVRFRLRRGGAQPPPLPPVEAAEGSYYGLLIGIGEYQHSDAFPKLDTPVSDARDLGDRLSRDWGFKSPVLLSDGDATFEKIVRQLDEFRRTLTEKDSLLVYFAGHGEFEKDAFGNEGGYWIPHDADADNRRTWISSRQIAHQVETLRAGSVLIMADACFSGFLTRSTISSAGGARSVSVLTSADESEALDKAAGERSPFARAVLEVLDTWTEKLPASKLANRVAAAFSGYYRSCESDAKPEERAFCEALADYGQEPQFKPVSEGGHEGGEFTFVPASR